MKNIITNAAAVIALVVASGCTAPHPFVREGDQNSVQIGYGGNVESAQPRARQFCEQYDRTPRLTDADGETATFECVPRR
jgi:hypothetical protein